MRSSAQDFWSCNLPQNLIWHHYSHKPTLHGGKWKQKIVLILKPLLLSSSEQTTNLWNKNHHNLQHASPGIPSLETTMAPVSPTTMQILNSQAEIRQAKKKVKQEAKSPCWSHVRRDENEGLVFDQVQFCGDSG